MEIKVNGIKLYYQVNGKGEPLVMVHGNGEDHTIFDKAIEVLKQYYTVYCLDSRGHGQSEKNVKISYELMASDTSEFIKALGLTKVNFYGFSDGGIIGLLIASKTSLIDKLIISGANLNPKGLKFTTRLLIKLMYFFKKDELTEMMLTQPDITKEDLAKIKCKTFVLAGENDLIKKEHTEYISQCIKDSQLMIIPKQGHGSYIVHNEKIGNIIIELLKKEIA